MELLSLLFGVIVGFSLGLTGGGGSIFAVPLLVYGLAIAPREAVVTSLAAVGATSFVGFLDRLRTGQVEVRTGLLFAVAGMIGAPFGSWLSGLIPETLLLILFAGLMLIVATRMWITATRKRDLGCATTDAADGDGPSCRRDMSGRLIMTSRCAVLLSIVGVISGVLSGLFGVGGGFVIVPALVLFSGMTTHRAVATSLLVITLISISGLTAHVMDGRSLQMGVTALFVIGGVAGMFAGAQAGRRLSEPTMRRVFSVAIVLVSLFVISRTVF